MFTSVSWRGLLIFLGVLLLMGAPLAAAAADDNPPSFPRPIGSYDDSEAGLWTQIAGRATAEPFNVVATALFFLAICHTFLAPKLLSVSHRFEHEFDELKDAEADPREGSRVAARRDSLQFKAVLFHFLGEIEVVFGLWAIPLAVAIFIFNGWSTTVHYFDGVNYTEPIFVFIIMAVASSKPILRFAESCLSIFAALGGHTPVAWWLSILTVGPILGSFITEPAAMTICALLLLDQFYKLNPSLKLRYATLGLLFVNISVGGTLSHFAAPPVVMVAGKWGWGFAFMFEHFGWKAVVGIIVSNALFFAWFRKELLAMKRDETRSARQERAIPIWITAVHLLIIVWTVLNSHYPALLFFGLLFLLAFVAATKRHQDDISLRSPMLVGFFLAALVVHGGCQQWWIAPVLGSLTRWPLMIGATILTAFNDNAAITYLASLVPGLTEPLKYAVMAGAVVGGGLTVIANAPNPAGQSILQKQFGAGGINPLGLLLGALVPTLIMGAAFMLLP